MATILTGLLETIIKSDATSQLLSNRFEEMFQDNKARRVVYLEERFKTTLLDDFSNICLLCSSQYQQANVGNLISENKMFTNLYLD